MNSKIVREIIKTAKKILPSGVRLILFGSQARGDNRPDSDWDLLLIADDENIYSSVENEITYPFVKLGWDLNVDINPIIYTSKKWEEHSFTPFYKNVTNEGITLWA